MKHSFKVTYGETLYQFEYDDTNGNVWLIEKNNIPSKINFCQDQPASNLNEAKQIAVGMLEALGY